MRKIFCLLLIIFLLFASSTFAVNYVTGIVEQYTFNSTAAGTISGANNFSFIGTPNYSNGYYGKGIEFFGTDCAQLVLADGKKTFSGNKTMMFWFKLNTNATTQQFFESYNDGQNNVQIYNSAGTHLTTIAHYVSNVANYGWQGITWKEQINTWQHITLVFDGTRSTAYLNGTLLTNNSAGSGFVFSALLEFGCVNNGANKYLAVIDDFRVYDYPMVSQNITAAMASESITTETPSGAIAPVINFTYPINLASYNDYNGTLSFTTDQNASCIINRTEWVLNITEGGTNHVYFYSNYINLSEGAHFINATCNVSTEYTTSILNFTIDLVSPLIEINSNNAFSDVNLSRINNYNNSLFLFNLSFFDNNDLYGYWINVTKNSVSYWSFLNQTLTGHKNVTVSHAISNTSLWPYGLLNIKITAADTHTEQKIKDYKVKEGIGNYLDFETGEKNKIRVTSEGSYYTKAIKSEDRYSMEFNYLLNSEERVFKITSDKPLSYIEKSEYPAHFVVWNDETNSGNWIDFAGIGNKYYISKIKDNEYEITFYELQEKNLILNSIGSLNVNTEYYSWFKGNYTANFERIATAGTVQNFLLNFTKLDGYVDDINANLMYNTTKYTTNKIVSENNIIFNSTFQVPEFERTYNVSWNVTVTKNDSTTYSFDINETQAVYLATLQITFMDEQNLTLITNESVTAVLTLEQSQTASTQSGVVTLGNLTLGEYYITASSTNYPTKSVFMTISNQSNYLTMYLLKTATGNQQVVYYIKDQDSQNVGGARATFQKLVNGTYITLAQGESDFAGQIQVFQDSNIEYRIIIDADTFPIKTLNLRPILTSYTITLDRTATSLYNNVWEGIYYTLRPTERIINITQLYTDVIFDIYSDDSSLEWFGIYIDKHNYTCIPSSCYTNVSPSPSGGTATIQILGNSAGTMDVHYFFKRTGFELQYLGGDLFGFQIIEALVGKNIANYLASVRENLGGRIAMSVFAAIFIIMLCVVGAQLGIAGLGLVFLAVLGNIFFTLAGFIDMFLGGIITIVGIAVFIVLMRND